MSNVTLSGAETPETGKLDGTEITELRRKWESQLVDSLKWNYCEEPQWEKKPTLLSEPNSPAN